MAKKPKAKPLPKLSAGAPGRPKGERYKEQYGLIIVCGDAAEQRAFYERLKAQGFNPRVVVT